MDGLLEKQNQKFLQRILRQEQKLIRKIARKDSVRARQLQLELQEERLRLSGVATTGSHKYDGHLDSLNTGLRFLSASGDSSSLRPASAAIHQLQGRFDQSGSLQELAARRRQLFKNALDDTGMPRALAKYQKEAYYYGERVKALQQTFSDPKKAEQELMAFLTKHPAFRSFFRKHSELGQLFRLPGGEGEEGADASLQGLQTQASVNQIIAARFGTGTEAAQALRANLQAAKGELQALQAKAAGLGSGSAGNGGAADLPAGFKPNTQKTKSLLQRLEYGVNIQNQKGSAWLPVTSDAGAFLGYKLNDKGGLGIGASYKLGWGHGFNDLKLTSEGVGLRSYLDYQLKGSLFISGGYEWNYRSAFASIEALKNASAWQRSGLIGLSKRYKAGKKLKGDLKLLWDFLSYQQAPKTQALVFRIGYRIK